MNKYEEALNRIAFNFGLDCLDENITEEEQDNLAKDITLINKLAEKEIPKKPIKSYYTERYGNNGKVKRVDILCPRCKSYFVNGARKSVGVFASREKKFIDSVEHTKYCMFCGQAIDWGD